MLKLKSIQRGVLSINATPSSTGTLGTATATISSVNRQKAIVEFGGASATLSAKPAALELNSSTTVKAYVYLPSGDWSAYVPYQVIEYY